MGCFRDGVSGPRKSDSRSRGMTICCVEIMKAFEQPVELAAMDSASASGTGLTALTDFSTSSTWAPSMEARLVHRRNRPA